MTDYKPTYASREAYYARKDLAAAERRANPGPEKPRASVDEVQCHDYRRQGWGHTCVFEHKLDDEGRQWKGYGFGTGIRGGDYVMLLNEPHVATYRVVSIEYRRDPPDMFRAQFEYHNGGFGVREGDIHGPIVRRDPLPPPQGPKQPGAVRSTLLRMLGRHR